RAYGGLLSIVSLGVSGRTAARCRSRYRVARRRLQDGSAIPPRLRGRDLTSGLLPVAFGQFVFLEQLFLGDGRVLHLGPLQDQVHDLLLVDRRAELGGGLGVGAE